MGRLSVPTTYTCVPLPGLSERQPPTVAPRTGAKSKCHNASYTSGGKGQSEQSGPGTDPSGIGLIGRYQPSYFFISGMTRSGPAEKGAAGYSSVLPTVTGRPAPVSLLHQRERMMFRDIDDNIDSVSMQGGENMRPETDNSSTNNCDSQSTASVTTDHTYDDKLPFHVTFTKAARGGERRAERSSPKSVRFSLPSQWAADEQVLIEDMPSIHGPSRRPNVLVTGSGVVDGFFLQPSSHPDFLGVSGSGGIGDGPRPPSSISMLSFSSSVKGPTVTNPAMKNRGTLSNSRQVPGRYFPPLMWVDEQRLFRQTLRVGSGVSSASAPPALNQGNINPLNQNSLANVSPSAANIWQGKGVAKKTALRTKAFCIESPGKHPTKTDAAGKNNVAPRDTSYNRARQDFWETYDSSPGNFTISFRDECPSYDPASFVHSDYYTVRRSSETPAGLGSSSPRRSPPSPFQGCLEGTMKRLHSKLINQPSLTT